MRFRGRGIRHKATRNWDEFLQWEGQEPQTDDLNKELETEQAGEEEDEDDNNANENEVEEGDAEDEEPDEELDDAHEVDHLVVDDREELNKDMYMGWKAMMPCSDHARDFSISAHSYCGILYLILKYLVLP